MLDADAVEMLTRDHDALKQLFRSYERLIDRGRDLESRALLAGRICCHLSVHLQIEEEIFLPWVQAAADRPNWLACELGDHACCKELIARLDEMEPGDDGYDTSVVILSAYAALHMDEEQQSIFTWVRRSGLDTTALGRTMAERHRAALCGDVTLAGLPRLPSRWGARPRRSGAS
ncbi:MAG TPA: hemerythrin domain-containing protein [Ideonella sp.]|nr:hemerythrin domain-containing protein [Ideonella sp.]